MKKILSLLSLMMLSIVGMNAQTIIYSWESPEGTPIETGGTIAYVNGDGDRLNYLNSGNYTICLNGKKANINDETPSANAGKMVITLDQALQAGDEIAITAYINKNQSKKSSAYIIFEKGGEVESAAFSDEANIDPAFNGSPQTVTVTVPEEAAGSKTITMTRGQTGTNLFITKLVITGERSAADKTIGLVPGPWAVDDATFAAYAWAEGVEAWFPFVEVSGVYATQIPDTLTSIILVRLKPATAEGFSTENYGLNWSNKWNQTADIDFTAIADQTIFTITGWGESDFTAASPLDVAKAALQAAIDKVKAYNLEGLADVIAAAEAAIAAEDATIESLQAAAATFEAGVKAYVKEILTTAIPMMESLNVEALANAINTAKAAVANEDATAEDLVNALLGMLESARPYIIEILGQTVDVCKSLGIDTSAAEALLSQVNEASTMELGSALLALTQTAIPTIQGVVNTLKEYMTTFSSDAASALKDYFDKLEADIANGNIAAVKDDIVLLMYNGSSYLQADIVKLEGYAAILDNEAITADVAAMKAAIQAGNFANLLAAVEKFKADFLAAAPNFVEQVKFAKAGYVDAGKTNALQQLEQAIANAEQALAADDATIVTVGLAIRNLIVAIQTYRAANSTYTIAGTKDLTGTEEDWQIVETNNMTKSAADYTYEWTAENVTVTSQNMPQFKVVIVDIDGNEAWIPTGGGETNWVITPDVVGGEGVFNITITYNAKTQEIGVTAEDVTTGINAVAAENTNAVIYNMSGQRVMNVQRGLYIINGKKVVLK